MYFFNPLLSTCMSGGAGWVLTLLAHSLLSWCKSLIRGLDELYVFEHQLFCYWVLVTIWLILTESVEFTAEMLWTLCC